MVFVDFSNAYLRKHLTNEFCKIHRRRLDAIREQLSVWVCESKINESRPLAVVFDIDEIILCNFHMNQYHVPGIDFYASDYFIAPDGQPWPRDDVRLNPILPGVHELLTEIRRLDIKIFLITGRFENIREETIENFIFVKLAGTDSSDIFHVDDIADQSILSMRQDKSTSVQIFKEECRKVIEKTHRIIFNIGDQASDLGEYGDKQIQCYHPFYFTE